MAKKAFLVVFFSLPVLAIAVIYWSVIYYNQPDRRTHMDSLPRVGQGANDTGGANAIGELLAGNPADYGSQGSPDAPVVPAEVTAQLSDGADAQPGSTLVAPESLPQGFVIVVKDLSNTADDEHPIYLASNHVGWNPGDASMKMQKRSDMRWQIVLPRPRDPNPIQFKFTLGSWQTVELSGKGEDNVPNRTLPQVDPAKYADGSRPVFEYEIPSFKAGTPAEDLQRLDPYRTLDVTGTVRRLQVAGGAGSAAASSRDLLVWIPPGYDAPENKQRRYPVLYLFDGQNLFEHLPNVYGEWHADETAQQLVESGAIEPLIIVGVPHAGPARMEEYVPVPFFRHARPAGDHFARWFTSEVMPRVEHTFRIRTERAFTGIGGASLGAVIAFYIAHENPDRFGIALLESMSSLKPDDGPAAWAEYIDNSKTWPSRVYIGMGAREAGEEGPSGAMNAYYIEWANRLAAAAKSAGVPDASRLLLIGENDAHNEDAWARRFPEALKFLYPPIPATPPATETPQPDVQFGPVPSTGG